jgi:23S rRNA (guanosine2251-2'-O)-methyltransferase
MYTNFDREDRFMSKEYEEKRGPRGADEHTGKRFPRERKSEERVPMRERDAEADGLIEGRNAVTEALRAGTPIDKIFIARGETDKTLGHIASTARAAGVVVVEADRRKLDYMSATKAHQGVIALAAVREYASVEDIISTARERGEAPLLVVCDEISDPHNLGAIIRTAECAGAHGVIIPKRRSAGLTSIVGKTSAGAVSYLPVARVPNIPALLKELQQQGVWIFGTAAEGATSLYEADLKGPAAIVIGSEGDGMGRLVREGCDFLVSIPMKGRISSLNASAAAAILLYEAVRQRLG